MQNHTHKDELSPVKIIIDDHTMSDEQAEKTIQVIQDRLDEGNSLLIRKYDSLYLITRIGIGEAEIHFFSVDDALRVVKASKYFIDQTRDSGIHTVYIKGFSDENMKRVLKMIKLTVQPSDKENFEYMVNLRRST
jgi:hypothetical protein